MLESIIYDAIVQEVKKELMMFERHAELELPDFGRRLKGLRQGKLWNQKTLAVQAQIPASQVCAYEHGKVQLVPVNLVKMAIVLEISLDHLVGLDQWRKERDMEIEV